MIWDDSKFWESIQVDMILDGSKFYGSTFCFNLTVFLLLGHCRSAAIMHNLMLLRLWVQLCEDTEETCLC